VKYSSTFVRKSFKNAADYVIRRFNASLAGRWGWTYAGKPLNAISRSNWSPESAEVRPSFLDAPREDGSWFRLETGLQLMQFNNPTGTKTKQKI
jgi:hypothetical protein